MGKRGWFFLALLLSGRAWALPDLVVVGLTTRPPAVLSDGRVSVGLRFTLRNQGTEIAGRFKTSIEAQGNPVAPGKFYALPLQVLSGLAGDGWYGWTTGVLLPGRFVDVTARVVFPKGWRGRRVKLLLWADSCLADEFMPEHCRIDETSEANNADLRDVRLP